MREPGSTPCPSSSGHPLPLGEGRGEGLQSAAGKRVSRLLLPAQTLRISYARADALGPSRSGSGVPAPGDGGGVQLCAAVVHRPVGAHQRSECRLRGERRRNGRWVTSGRKDFLLPGSTAAVSPVSVPTGLLPHPPAGGVGRRIGLRHAVRGRAHVPGLRSAVRGREARGRGMLVHGPALPPWVDLRSARRPPRCCRCQRLGALAAPALAAKGRLAAVVDSWSGSALPRTQEPPEARCTPLAPGIRGPRRVCVATLDDGATACASRRGHRLQPRCIGVDRAGRGSVDARFADASSRSARAPAARGVSDGAAAYTRSRLGASHVPRAGSFVHGA